MFVVTPVAGGLLVWLAFLAANALAGPAAGAAAAVLAAASPILLYQVVQPMNDVATAALWLGAFTALESGRWRAAGICCGLALLVRPNLLPLALVAALYVPRRHLIGFGACMAPFLAVILWLNSALYGGPLRSGYGQAATLFHAASVPVNAGRYARWFVETHTIVPLAGFLAPALLRGEAARRAWLAIALIAATAVVYLPYTPFDDWSYLRFFIPAITLLMVLTGAVLTAAAGRLRGGGVAATAVTLALALFFARAAQHGLVFHLRALEQRYRSAAAVVRERLPPDAVLLTGWDSGAIRFHARREVVVWDALDPGWLDRAVDWLRSQGRSPYILLESWEEPLFRRRFEGAGGSGALDWPARYEVDRVVRIYDPADRRRFLAGGRIRTEYLWPERGTRRARAR